MNQTSTILFYLVAAYIIFITARGELPKYAAVFFSPASAAPATPTVLN